MTPLRNPPRSSQALISGSVVPVTSFVRIPLLANETTPPRPQVLAAGVPSQRTVPDLSEDSP
jgi:hypothetical protein